MPLLGVPVLEVLWTAVLLLEVLLGAEVFRKYNIATTIIEAMATVTMRVTKKVMETAAATERPAGESVGVGQQSVN